MSPEDLPLHLDHAGWLGILLLGVGLATRLLKTDAFDRLLAALGISPLPKAWLPWLALALSFLAGAGRALRSGASWQEAAQHGVLALFGGAGSVAVNETLSSALAMASPRARDVIFGSKAGPNPGPCSTRRSVTPPPPPPASTGPVTPKTGARMPSQPPGASTRRSFFAPSFEVSWAVGGLVPLALLACGAAQSSSCTPSDRATAAVVAKDSAAGCGVLTAVAGAPELAPVCAAIPEIEAAIAELIAEHQAAQVGAAAIQSKWHPSDADIHRRLARKRGTSPVDGGVEGGAK